MLKKIVNTSHEQQALEDRSFRRKQSPEERLDTLERLRLEAGSFLYEYPTRLQRIIRVSRKK